MYQRRRTNYAPRRRGGYQKRNYSGYGSSYKRGRYAKKYSSRRTQSRFYRAPRMSRYY